MWNISVLVPNGVHSSDGLDTQLLEYLNEEPFTHFEAIIL